MTDWWQNRPWREIQTNLREIDMLDIQAERVVADLQAFKANVLMINAAGIIASYPTALPFHFQSPFLKGDSLEQIIEACHKADIRVVARTDFSKVRRPIYEAHPEWAYLSPEGKIADYNGDVHVCINGDYQQHYAPKIMEELLTRLDFDGIFFNMGGYQTRDYSGNYYGICHCRRCQQGFQEMFGLPLPKKEDLADPVFRKYSVFKQYTLRAHHEKVYRFITDLRPDICIANHLEFRRGFIRQESNTAINRPLPHWQYSASDNTKWATSSYPAMVSSNTTVDFIDFPYRHVTVSPQQQKLRLAQSLANGGALDYYLIGRLDNHEDRSGYIGIKEIFHYHASNEQTYLNIRSKANIALLNGPYANTNEFRGWFRFLVENHFLFDTLMVDTALELPWDKYQAIILPDLQALSDELANRIDQFVSEGGILISVSQSGFRDAGYELRSQPALKSPGIEQVQRIRTDMISSYFKLDDKRGFSRFVETDLIYMDGSYIYAQYTAKAEPRLKLIPPHNYGPPERCYYELITDQPGFIVHPFGRGKAIYIPWLPGSLFHRQGYVNTTDFVTDLLEGVAGLIPVQGNLSPMVEVTRFEKIDGSYELLHLVNGSGHFGVSFFAPVTMTNIEVAIPSPQQPKTLTSLVWGRSYNYTWQDGHLTVQIPRLELFDAIKIE
jgi:hypothetical protein